MGGNTEEPAPVAFSLRRPGYGAPGRRTRTHLPRPLLERVFRGPKVLRQAAREHYAKLYAQPGAMHAGFSQFAAFDQDAIDNLVFLSRFRLANQRIGFLRFAACADSQGVWHGGKVSGYGER